MTNQAAKLIEQWLEARISTEHLDWLKTQCQKISSSNSDRELHITLGLIPRKLGRADLSLDKHDLAAANAVVHGWNPSTWSIDTAARIAVLCKLADHNPERFKDIITDLCRNADLAEGIALYSGIALYPHSDDLDKLVGEGLRTNMRAVFEAIAHNNPYPARHFNENRWNHMVLKALFIDSRLAPIQDLEKRANAELATILCDYAHERWATERPVNVELWRCVGPFATGSMIGDLQKVTESRNPIEHQAGVLALSHSPQSIPQNTLSAYPETASNIARGSLTWSSLNIELQNQSGIHS